MDFINNLFPRTLEEIEQKFNADYKIFNTEFNKVLELEDTTRDFQNTVQEIDDICYRVVGI